MSVRVPSAQVSSRSTVPPMLGSAAATQARAAAKDMAVTRA
jgi:hypothetical protein